MAEDPETRGAPDPARIADELEPVLRGFVADANPDPGPAYQRFANDEICTTTRPELVKTLRFLSYLLAPVPKGASILDVGSGYGLNALLVGLLGYRRVTGIELVDSLRRNSELLLEHARSRLARDLAGVEAVAGDVQRAPFDDASFDCLLCIEVVSHVVSQDAFFREANRLLPVGGLLVISDGCNITDPRAHRRLRESWARVRAEELEERRRYLAEKHPEFDPAFRTKVALHTELLGREALEEVLPGIVATGELPSHEWVEGTAPVYFESGIWAEYGIELGEFEKRLRRYGFSPRVRVSLGGCRGPAFHAAETFLNLLPRAIRYRARPVFRCWAEKRRGL